MRFENSPDLFGVGIGISTCGDIRCGICGNSYNQGNDENEDYGGESVGHTDFAGLCVCDCCFEKIEYEVWLRRREIIGWLARRFATKVEDMRKEKDLFKELQEAIH